jgi:hypothetical protein
MRKRVVATVLGIFCGALVLLWWLRSPKPPNENSSSKPLAPETNAQTGVQQKKSIQTAQLDEALNALQTSNASNGNLTSHLEGITNALQEWNKNVTRPIEFFGMVEDQDDQPVAGATVTFSYNLFTSPEGSSVTNVFTDTNGLFSLSGVSGSTLEAHVAKDGYYSVRNGSQNYFKYLTLPGSEPFHPDARNPVVFRLKKKGAGAKLITSENGIRNAIGITGLYDGVTIKRIDFFNHQVGNEGQLELSAMKPSPGQPQSEWSFRLSIPDGGLIEENDEFPFEAPESGYKTEIDFDFRAGDTNWTTTLQKHFYIKFGQPPKYGWVSVDTAIDRGTYLRYAVNPDGTRNLEPVEAKPSTPTLPPWAPPGTKVVIPEFK